MQDLKSRLHFLLRQIDKLKKSSSTETRKARKGLSSYHRTHIERPIRPVSLLQSPFIVVLGRCACIYLHLTSNTMPIQILCIHFKTCGDVPYADHFMLQSVMTPIPSTIILILLFAPFPRSSFTCMLLIRMGLCTAECISLGLY